MDIVVCTKNNEDTIKQSLQRILAYASPRRIIVIDGLSKDRTTQIAAAMGAEVHTDYGKGLGYARNMALGLAKSSIVGFVDADAYIQANWLTLGRHMVDRRVAAASATTLYGYGNLPLQRFHEWMAKRGGQDVGFVSTLVRKSAVLEVGGIREDLTAYEDWELKSRFDLHGFKWVCDREVVTLHPESLGGFLTHARRWGQGARRSGVDLNKFLRPFLTSPLWGIRLSAEVHPIHSIYYPLLRLAYLKGYLSEAAALA